MSIKKGIFTAIGGVMVVTVIARLLALFSNQFYMSFFGASDISLNIYSYAVNIPNVLFNSLGTALATVVIPIFAALLVKGEKKEAADFASGVLVLSTMAIGVLVVIGMALSPVLISFTDFGRVPETAKYATFALIVLMPMMLFYGISYVYQGILQSYGSFLFPAALSVPSSIIVIAYVALLGAKFGVTGLLFATVTGLAAQAVFLIIPAHKSGFRFNRHPNLKSEHIKKAKKLIVPVLIGSGAFQVNMLYNITLMANFKSMVTLLTFVQNIVISSVLAIVYSITAVVYPQMTKQFASGDMPEFKKTLSVSINWLVFLFVPLSVGMMIMSKPLLTLISQYGKMTAGDIDSASKIMTAYAICLAGIALKELVDRAFYATQNTKTPAVCGFITVGTNIVFSQIAIRFIGAYGVPLAYSVSCFCAVGFLLVMLHKKIGALGGKTPEVLVKSLISAALMGVSLYFACSVFSPGAGVLSRVIAVAVPFVIGVSVYFISAFVLRTSLISGVLKKGDKI